MTAIIIIVSICLFADLLIIFACCKVAGESDRSSEQQYLQYIKSKTTENNNTNDKGE
jgi:hypothetical protein